MIINGNLKFHTVGLGEIQNFVVERMTTAERTAATHADGRMVFDTTEQAFYFSSGSTWDLVGDATTTGNIITSLGAVVNASGVYVPHTGTAYINGNADITQDLLDLDAAIGAAAGADSVATLTDTTITTSGANELLFTTAANTWVNYTLSEAGIQAQDAVLDDISALAVIADNQLMIGTGAGTLGYLTMDPYMQGIMGSANDLAFSQAVNLEIGVDVQAYDADLTTLAGLASTDSNFIVGSAGGWVVETGAIVRTSLGLSIGSDVQAYDATIVVDADIGSTVQGYDVDTAKLDVAQSWAALQKFPDSQFQIIGSVTASKIVAFEVDGLTTATTRTITVADQDIDMTPSTGSYEAADAGLLSIAGLTTVADRMIYTTASDVYAVTTLTTQGRQLIDDASFAAMRTTLGLGSAALSATTDFLSGTASDNILIGNTITVDSGGFINAATGGTISMVDAPGSANELTNKAYVDALVAAGASWKNPVVDSDLVEITATNPGTMASLITTYSLSVGDNVCFIASAVVTFNAGGVQVVGTTAGDIVNLSVISGTVGDYSLIETPLAAGDRFIIAAEHGTIGAVLTAFDVNNDTFTLANADLIEYVSGTITDDQSWSTPDGRSGNAGGGIEIEQGVTVLNADPDSVHYGHSYLYDQTSNAWVEISGPGAIGAGVGLSYTGSTLNVGMGAGIVALPADEVGVDLYDVATNPLIITASGTDRVTTSAGQLNLLLDSTTLSKGSAGLKVATGGITNTEVNASAAIAFSKLEVMTSGNILVGSGGNVATEVTMQGDATIIANGTLTIAAGAVTRAKMENLTATQFIVGNVSNIPTAVAMGGDVTMDNVGAVTINDNAVTLAKMAGLASANFILGNGTGDPTAVTMGGDVLMTNDGTTNIQTNAIVTANITDANVTNAKLANSTIIFKDDAAATDAVALGETIEILGTDAIDTAVTANTMTISAKDATSAQKGVATFNTANFTVTTGDVTLNSSLDDLTDAAVSGPAGGETLVYNGTNAFVNRKIYHVYNSTMVSEVSTIATVAETGTNYDNKYFLLSSTGVDYYFWFNVATAGVDPAPAGKTLGGVIAVANSATADAIASTIQGIVNGHAAFTATVSTNTATITTVIEGDTTDANAGDSPVTAGTTTQGGIPATSHTVTHNIGQQYCNVTVVDSTDEMIIPESVKFDSTSALTVTFNSSIDCRVIVMGINPGA